MKVFGLIWQGIWMGIGAELSLFSLWVAWKVAHLRYITKLDPKHWLHTIAEYFE
jgi:hypothetical protein